MTYGLRGLGVNAMMTDQEVFELGQLYAELSLIRSLISCGAGVRQRLLPQYDCEALEGIAKTSDTVIRKLMVRIDEHKQARNASSTHE